MVLLSFLLAFSGLAAAQTTPVIQSFSVPDTMVGSNGAISATLFNPGGAAQNYFLSVSDQIGDRTPYHSEQYSGNIGPNQSKTISFTPPWSPAVSGNHSITLTVFSQDKKQKIENSTITKTVPGNRSIELHASCGPTITQAGNNIDYNIIINNHGTYLERLGVDIGVEGVDGSILYRESQSVVIEPGQQHVIRQTLFIPESAVPGLHILEAAIPEFNQTTQCAFEVDQRKGYYAQALQELKKQWDSADQKVAEKKAEGFETASLETKLESIQLRIGIWSQRIDSGKTSGATETFGYLKDELNSIEQETRTLAQKTILPLFISTVNDALLIALAIITIIIAISLLWKGTFDKILGIEGKIKL